MYARFAKSGDYWGWPPPPPPAAAPTCHKRRQPSYATGSPSAMPSLCHRENWLLDCRLVIFLTHKMCSYCMMLSILHPEAPRGTWQLHIVIVISYSNLAFCHSSAVSNNSVVRCQFSELHFRGLLREVISKMSSYIGRKALDIIALSQVVIRLNISITACNDGLRLPARELGRLILRQRFYQYRGSGVSWLVLRGATTIALTLLMLHGWQCHKLLGHGAEWFASCQGSLADPSGTIWPYEDIPWTNTTQKLCRFRRQTFPQARRLPTDWIQELAPVRRMPVKNNFLKAVMYSLLSVQVAQFHRNPQYQSPCAFYRIGNDIAYQAWCADKIGS